MKKSLSLFALLCLFAVNISSAEAFCWSNLNPAYWGHCPKCEKKKTDCDCQKNKPCNPCETGMATPCNPCEKIKKQPCNPCVSKPTKVATPTKSINCDPCDKLQNMNK